MASNTLIDSYGAIGWGDQCLGVEIEVEKKLTDEDPLAVGLGFFFGLIIGGLIGLLCGKLCIKDYARSRYSDEESAYAAKKGYANHEKNKMLLTGNAPSKSKKQSTMRRRKKRGDDDDDVLVPAAVISLAAPAPQLPEDPVAPEPGYSSDSPGMALSSAGPIGMVSALVQTNPEAMNAELADQDLEAVDELDKELREEGINTMVQMLRVMLAKEMGRGGMTEDEYKELVVRMQDNVGDVVSQCQREQEEEEEALKKKYSKNPDQLDAELEKLNSKYINKMNSMLKDEKDRLRSDLNKSTKMTEDEVDALIAEFTDNMAGLEKKLGAERARMAASLEDRLARRKALVEAHNLKTEQQKHEIDYRKDAHDKSLQSLVDDGKLMERQKNEILDKYEADLRQIQMKQNQHVQEQQLKLADKLKERREAQQRKLAAQQEKEREQFVKRADKATNPGDVSDAYHQMLSQQRIARDEMNDELDNEEADAFDRLRKDYEKQRQEEIARREDELQDTIQSRCQLTQKDADRLMRVHEAEMEEYERMRKAEKKRMNAALEEKLEQRRLRAEEEQATSASEALALKEQQDTTIKRVLESQLELDQEARDRILKEHEQNTQAVNNQLQMSKLRQQKALEKRLAQKRAKVSELKQKQEVLEITAKSEGKDNKKQVAELQKQIETEETRLEKEKKDKLNELRQRLAAETEEALKEQEKQIGLLIARLEVGAARRQAIIQQQSQTIKELEEQMANKVSEEGSDAQKDWQVDHLIHQHQNQMEHLNDKLQETKERQEQILMEKLQAKKLRKEREIDREIEKEAHKDHQKRRMSNAGNDSSKKIFGMASTILSNLMLEQRHKAAMKELEKEMQVEMAKQREELNRELEDELKIELEEQKKSFLAQLAAISNVSKAEMNEIVENAVIDSGGDEKEAKKLSKEMRQELVRAKSNLGEQFDRRRSSGYGPRDYDNDDDYRRPPSGRPTSGRPISGPRDYDNDDDYRRPPSGRPTSGRPISGRRRPPSGQRDY